MSENFKQRTNKLEETPCVFFVTIKIIIKNIKQYSFYCLFLLFDSCKIWQLFIERLYVGEVGSAKKLIWVKSG